MMTQQPKTDGLDALKREVIRSLNCDVSGSLANAIRCVIGDVIDHLAQRGMLQGGWMPAAPKMEEK